MLYISLHKIPTIFAYKYILRREVRHTTKDSLHYRNFTLDKNVIYLPETTIFEVMSRKYNMTYVKTIWFIGCGWNWTLGWAAATHKPQNAYFNPQALNVIYTFVFLNAIMQYCRSNWWRRLNIPIIIYYKMMEIT